MTARQSRAWMLWTAGTIAVVGAILYGFLRYEPEPIDVSSPAAAWTARWQDARRCLLGQEPPADTATDAMAIREVWLKDPTEVLDGCVGKLAAARFELQETTGSVELDAAWHDVSTGVRAVREQLRVRLATKTPVTTLGAAIDDVDKAYARLRRTAGLPPAPLPVGAAIPRYPEGEVLELADGGPVLPRRVEVAGDLVVAYHHAGQRARRLVFRDGALESNSPVSDLLVAAGDPSWAVVARDVDSSTLGGLEVIPVDGDGRATGATPVVAVHRPAASATLQARFAIGDGDLRAIAYRLVEERAAVGLPPPPSGDRASAGRSTETGAPVETGDTRDFEPDTVASLAIAASGNGGNSWGQGLSVEGGAHGIETDDSRGRADVWWTDEHVGTSWLRIDRGSLPVIVAASVGATGVAPLEWTIVPDLRAPPQAACFANGAAWWIGPGSGGGGLTLHHLAVGDGAPARPAPAPASAGAEALYACADDQLVIRTKDGLGHVCGESQCAEWPASAPSGVELVSMTDDGPVATFSVGDLVFAVRPGDDRPRPQFRKQLKAEVVGAVSWRGEVQLVVHDVDRVRLVPLASGL